MKRVQMPRSSVGADPWVKIGTVADRILQKIEGKRVNRPPTRRATGMLSIQAASPALVGDLWAALDGKKSAGDRSMPAARAFSSNGY